MEKKRYKVIRDDTGGTPRQQVDLRRAQLLSLEIAEKRGLLIEKSVVETGMRECAEVVGSDLFGALPSQCATVLGGKRLPAEKVRAAVLEIIGGIVDNWISAELVPGEVKKDEKNNVAQRAAQVEGFKTLVRQPQADN